MGQTRLWATGGMTRAVGVRPVVECGRIGRKVRHPVAMGGSRGVPPEGAAHLDDGQALSRPFGEDGARCFISTAARSPSFAPRHRVPIGRQPGRMAQRSGRNGPRGTMPMPHRGGSETLCFSGSQAKNPR